MLLVFAPIALTMVSQDRATAAANPVTIREIACLATPATATILAISSTGDTLGQGSGFFISPEGQPSNVLVTNFHVLAGAKRAIIVHPGGRAAEATFVLAADQRIASGHRA